MEHTELVEAVKEWVRTRDRRPEGERKPIDEDTDLMASSTLDSVAFVELLIFVEEQTGRPVDLEDVDPTQFTTMRGLCRVAAGER